MENLKEKVVDQLLEVYDPEIPVNIYDLGLVYELNINENNDVFVTMTLTAPACPVAGQIVMDVTEKINAIPEVNDVHVDLTFEPPWTMDMMTDEARLELGFM